MDRDLQSISDLINVVPNFPKDGIFFRDISPLLANGEMSSKAIDMQIELVRGLKFDVIAGLESRGFIFGSIMADRLKLPFVMLRKPNKLPDTIHIDYGKEYGKDILTVQKGLIKKGLRVLIVDDLIASGGSLFAACQLIKMIDCVVAGCLCLIELVGIDKHTGLTEEKIFSLIKYPAHSSDKFISKDDEVLTKKRIEYLPLKPLFEDDNRIIVFSHPSMKSFADNLVSKSTTHFRSGTITWDHFPDGYPNIKFEHPEYLENKRVIFVMSLYNQKYLFEQLSMIMVLPRQFVKSLNIILTYFAPATMERVDEEGTLATAETAAKIISSCLPLTREGLSSIHIVDIHAVSVRFYFSDNISVRLESAIPLLKQRISQETTTIAFPDQGAYKRFKCMFEGFRIIVCSKIRGGDTLDISGLDVGLRPTSKRDTRKIQIADRFNFPRDDSKCLDEVLIVDDLVQSGGTLEECRKALLLYGAKQVSAYVTHAVFPNKAYTKFINENFHKFYITNSIPENANILKSIAPFEVIELETMFIEKLLKSFEIPSDLEFKSQTFTIYVASTNEAKLRAVDTVLSKKLLNISGKIFKLTVYGISVPSGVPEQPINDQTSVGCNNRMTNLENYIKHYGYDYDMLISIENGVQYSDKTDPYDFCAVAINSKNDIFGNYKCGNISRDKTYFPSKYLIESMNYSQTVTVGSIIEKENGLLSGSWHEKFNTDSKTRFDIIRDMLDENIVVM